MTAIKSTIGKALDDVLAALSTLDKKQQQIVISTACALLEFEPTGVEPLGQAKQPMDVQANPPPASSRGSAPDRGMDIRTLKEKKQPDSARQMACVVAYYLQEHAGDDEKRSAVSAADLEKYFKQASYPLPSKMPQILVDAKLAGYFEQVSRGEYKLTRVGYNLVAHSLPKSAKAQA